MRSSTDASNESKKLYDKLANSAVFSTYQTAFNDALGLNLSLVPVDEMERSENSGEVKKSQFCDALNREKSCRDCIANGQCLKNPADSEAITTICFAGMTNTSIPIKSGSETVAFLCTGHVFTEEKKPKNFVEVASHLRRARFSETKIEQLEALWIDIPYMPLAQYQGIITLLSTFAAQLSDLSNRIMIEDENSEPEIVTRAKRYVNANLEEKVNLEEVAKCAGVSTFYFCKVFKTSTGMTLTEYVNRRRIEWAKRKLLNPQSRVTEVAFDVGYQSLSQFNRSFLKYVGMSPTKFREQQIAKNSSQSLIAA